MEPQIPGGIIVWSLLVGGKQAGKVYKGQREVLSKASMRKKNREMGMIQLGLTKEVWS